MGDIIGLFHKPMISPECSQDYPNLEQVFFDVVDRVNAQPVTLEVTRHNILSSRAPPTVC